MIDVDGYSVCCENDLLHEEQTHSRVVEQSNRFGKLLVETSVEFSFPSRRRNDTFSFLNGPHPKKTCLP